MICPYERELLQKAFDFIAKLKSADISAEIVEDSFRTYSVKVAFSREGIPLGNGTIYYSPGKKSFKFSGHELKEKSALFILEEAWHREEGNLSALPGLHAFVDGSFRNGEAAFGAVVLRDNRPVAELSGRIKPGPHSSTRQILGELKAVEAALEWSKKNKVKEITIHYDYLGIEKWATRAWKTASPVAKEYAQFIGNTDIKIRWKKVAGHSGNRWNERADELAGKCLEGIVSKPVFDEVRINEAMKTAVRFIDFLKEKKEEASLLGYFNEQFARIEIKAPAGSRGYFDLYNTARKRLSPYIHSFKNSAKSRRIEHLWKTFRQSHPEIS